QPHITPQVGAPRGAPSFLWTQTCGKLFTASPLWLSAVQSFKTLDTSNARVQNEGDRAQEARGPCTDQGCPFTDKAVREKKRTFFGAFLAFTKKVPAGRRTAEAVDPKPSHWIPAYAG